MARIFIILIYSMVVLVLGNCKNADSGISQLWFYTYGDGSSNKINLTPVNFVELRPDGFFTSDLGSFNSGHWALKDQQLFLKGDDGSENILFINAIVF